MHCNECIPFVILSVKANSNEKNISRHRNVLKTCVRLVYMGCHHAMARPNEKKLIDIIEFRCNKLQWSKIYGNLARNFKVNGILSKLFFMSNLL